MGKNDALVVKKAPPPKKAKFESGGPQVPEEVAAANYTLDLLSRFAMDPVVPASIIEILDHRNTIEIGATFPGHPELADLGWFQVGLDGDQLEVVEIRCIERESGEYDNLPFLAGAVKGVFEALLKTHRHELDLLRMNVAYLAEIRLKPAGEGGTKKAE